MNLYEILSKVFAPDGYLVEFIGKDYRDEVESLRMVLNDYDGYEIVELSQTTGRKKRLAFLLKDK
jgi:hypothetical protein